MIATQKIRDIHLQRRATVYLRQSTLRQVHEHRESTERQYALRDRAAELGCPVERIAIVDEDLGCSGSSTEGRSGFQRLAEDVAHGRVGAILALETSRLARSSADWHRLLELCALANVVIIDEQAVYSPNDPNDRLLLGLKGTMSEAEQYWMRLRLQGGKLNKARRGALFMLPPIGYEWDREEHRYRLDSDAQVQEAVRLVFERFRVDGSSNAVGRYLREHGIKVPSRDRTTRELSWNWPRNWWVIKILRNPAYTGACVFGRREGRAALVDGQVKRKCRRWLAEEEWQACLKDHHPAYISWKEYMANQRTLTKNRTSSSFDRRGPAREGAALHQGLAMCGRCGTRMYAYYVGSRERIYYRCVERYPKQCVCFQVSGNSLDAAVARLFLEATSESQVDLSLAVLRETERQSGVLDKQWKLRRDRAGYEARLAERRYKAVDPDNRVVARTLESKWNDKLKIVEETE